MADDEWRQLRATVHFLHYPLNGVNRSSDSDGARRCGATAGRLFGLWSEFVRFLPFNAWAAQHTTRGMALFDRSRPTLLTRA